MGLILTEESNKVEYKEQLPKDNIRWLKTVVSFSNTAGGDIIIGVEDETLEIVGVQESRFELELKIIETVYNNIVPTPIINIKFQNM